MASQKRDLETKDPVIIEEVRLADDLAQSNEHVFSSMDNVGPVTPGDRFEVKRAESSGAVEEKHYPSETKSEENILFL